MHTQTWNTDFNLAVETAGPSQSFIQRVRAVSRCNHKDPALRTARQALGFASRADRGRRGPCATRRAAQLTGRASAADAAAQSERTGTKTGTERDRHKLPISSAEGLTPSRSVRNVATMRL